MEELVLTLKEVRKYLIHYQGLDGNNIFSNGDGIIKYFERIGCIQYDPLNVVGRNPDLVLQSRIRGYKADHLNKLLYTDRTLVDGWDKMMSIYLSSDWPYFSRVRKAMDTSVKNSLKYRDSLHAINYREEIRNILKTSGPLQAAKIDLGSTGKGSWGHRKISGATMDYMFNIGEIGVAKKHNTQKIYDLIENLLPHNILEASDPFKDDEEFYRWYILRRIGSIGLLWDKSGGGWLGHAISKKKLRIKILEDLVSEGSLITVQVPEIDQTFYIRRSDLNIIESSKKVRAKKIRFLAPLDNLLWDRDMVELLFNFKYRWEVYTPVNKREYGYYVLPILYGDKLIGRFEAEQQRGNDPLIIKKWWWQDNVIITPKIEDEINKALKRFCNYLGAEGSKSESIS